MVTIDSLFFKYNGKTVADVEIGELLKSAAQGMTTGLSIQYDIDETELVDGDGELYPLDYILETVRTEVISVEEIAPGKYCLTCNPLEGITPESFTFNVETKNGFPEYDSDELPDRPCPA